VLQGVFTDGEHGYLVEQNELADVTTRLLADRVRLKVLGRNARKYAEQQFQRDAVSQALRAALDKVWLDRAAPV
jgi:hypothetical protein